MKSMRLTIALLLAVCMSVCLCTAALAEAADDVAASEASPIAEIAETEDIYAPADSTADTASEEAPMDASIYTTEDGAAAETAAPESDLTSGTGVPKMGDETNVTLWIVLAIACVGVIGVAGWRMKAAKAAK